MAEPLLNVHSCHHNGLSLPCFPGSGMLCAVCANRDEIEADIAAEDLEATHLETQHALRRNAL